VATVRERARARIPSLPALWGELPLVLVVGAVAIGLAGLVSVRQFAGAASVSEGITRLERQRAELEARNGELEAELSYFSSLSRIEQEARQRLGMVKPTEVVYLQVENATPPEPKLPERYWPQEAPAPPAPSRPWWQRLFSWLPLP
jgi:cell division protein FtsB